MVGDVVADQEEMREGLRELLEVSGHEVLAAEDGLQGLELAKQSPEFIFCDVDMPNLNGHGMLTEIKKMPGVCDVPFVFVTGRAERSQLREGMGLGADDYITKPYEVTDILNAIASRTKRQGGLRERIKSLSAQQHREMNAQWSHELLTPLNAVLGSLDLLESDADTIDRKELKEMLGLIREGAERQERLARKLIAYFSLEQLTQATAASGKCAAEEAIMTGASRAAQRKNRVNDVKLLTVAGEVALPEDLLSQAMAEVVENAASFSKPGTAITVSSAVRGGNYVITITDEGPGLTAEQRAQVGAFAQFNRKVHEQQGLGLGLAIARHTARLAGGELRLDAGPQGRGLLVEFVLPLAKG